MMEVAHLINVTLNHLVLEGIKYEKIGGEIFEMRLFEEDGNKITFEVVTSAREI